MTTDALYETDLVLWAEQQASRLRQAQVTGSNLPLDWQNLAEEIESMGGSERREARSLVTEIVAHLLKLALSPAARPRAGWESEVCSARYKLELCLEDSPSLRPRLPEFLAKAVPQSRRTAARSLREHGEDEAARQAERIPLDLTPEDVLDSDFFLPSTVFRREPE